MSIGLGLPAVKLFLFYFLYVYDYFFISFFFVNHTNTSNGWVTWKLEEILSPIFTGGQILDILTADSHYGDPYRGAPIWQESPKSRKDEYLHVNH